MLSKLEQNTHSQQRAVCNSTCLKEMMLLYQGVKDLTILTNHKLLEFFKTQSKLSRRQTGWMELIGNFDFKLTYHPGRELLQANALSCIYVQELQSDGSLDPDWPMYYALIKNNIYPTNVLNRTLEKLIKNKSNSRWTKEPCASKRKIDFWLLSFPCHNGLKQSSGTTAAYGHTCSRNLYLFMQDKAWWPGMIKDIQDILKHCKTCNKHTSTPLPSKSVLCDDGNPFDQWAIDIIGPMPFNKQEKKL